MSQIVNLKKIVFWFFFKLPTFFLSVWKHLIISHLMKPEDNYHKRCHGRDHHNDTLDGTADVTILVLVTWARKLVHVILPLTHWVSSFERRFGKPLQVAIYIFNYHKIVETLRLFINCYRDNDSYFTLYHYTVLVDSDVN